MAISFNASINMLTVFRALDDYFYYKRAYCVTDFEKLEAENGREYADRVFGNVCDAYQEAHVKVSMIADLIRTRERALIEWYRCARKVKSLSDRTRALQWWLENRYRF